MEHEPLEHLYFNWLYSKVADLNVHTPSLSFFKLLGTLHRTEYVWTVVGDDNRAEDGVELRIEFLRESFIRAEDAFFVDGCSVLEMLVAFSRRASFTTDEDSRDWFWRMIENLGLIELNDAAYPTHRTDVNEVIHAFVWRTYTHNGEGGLFPVRHSPNDQREVEVWYQFSEYLMEHDQG